MIIGSYLHLPRNWFLRFRRRIKMGSPVQFRRYPRSCKEDKKTFLAGQKPLSRHGGMGRSPKFQARRPAGYHHKHLLSGEKQG